MPPVSLDALWLLGIEGRLAEDHTRINSLGLTMGQIRDLLDEADTD